MVGAAATGFFTALSLILAIGAQNAFVLRQGLIGAHVLPLVLFCATSDAILITAGVAGFATITTLFPMLPAVMAIGGAVFLIAYGLMRLHAAWRGDYEMVLEGRSGSLKATLATAAAITWLNPHVYLDTLGLIGAVSVRYPDVETKIVFGIAAVTASFVFFASLGFGARLLQPIMQSARAWRILDTGIALVMFAIAAGLIASL